MLDRTLCSFIVLVALFFVQFHYSWLPTPLDRYASLDFLLISGFMVSVVELLVHSYLRYVSILGTP